LFHADPLIYYAKMESEYKYHEKACEATESIRDVQLSATYGENDVEAEVAWLKTLVDNKLDVTGVDAYVIFNSTFYIDDLNIDLQMIHGGFKALHWSHLGCYIGSSTSDLYCFDIPSDSRNVVKSRVLLNPHYIRYQEYKRRCGEKCERECFNEEAVLMIVGDETSWFFSLPIAPPPLYFIAQGRVKKEKSKEIIRTRLGDSEREVECRVQNVLKERELDNVPENIRQSLNEFLVRNYYRGEALDFIEPFRKGVEEIIHHNRGKDRSQIAEEVLARYYATPQIRYSNGNYSYLDLIICRDYKRCPLAWVFGLSLLVLLDSYVKFVEEQAGSQARSKVC